MRYHGPVFHPFRATIFAPLPAPDIQPQTWSYLKQLINDLLLDRHMRRYKANFTTILPVVPFIDLHGMVYFRIVAMGNEYQITHTYSLTRIAIPQSLRIKDTVVFGDGIFQQRAAGKDHSIGVVVVERDPTGPDFPKSVSRYVGPFKSQQHVRLESGRSVEHAHVVLSNEVTLHHT